MEANVKEIAVEVAKLIAEMNRNTEPAPKVEPSQKIEAEPAPQRPGATYELKYPITVKGNRIEKITLRRAKYGDIELAISQAKGNSADVGRNLICNLAGLSHEEFRELDFIDFTRLSKFAKTFFADGETETILNEIGLE